MHLSQKMHRGNSNALAFRCLLVRGVTSVALQYANWLIAHCRLDIKFKVETNIGNVKHSVFVRRRADRKELHVTERQRVSIY